MTRQSSRENLSIVIGGEAGQGLLTMGQVLARSLVRSGHHLLVTQSYQSRIRGGHNIFAIRAGRGEIRAPREAVDLLVALDADTVSRHRAEVADGGTVMMDASHGITDKSGLNVPLKELASDRYANTAALGVVSALIGLRTEVVEHCMEKAIGKAHPQMVAENREALRSGIKWGVNYGPRGLTLSAPGGTSTRIMINGNEAIALSAVACGLKFYSFYPMTPSTSIGLNLASWSHRMGLVVEQAEDEIAAINMALGAAYAGAPSMVGTSGGGFALMAEGVSLAGMTETPVVIVVAQRPAPATGLPTRTEQADLEFALHVGHGEFPRAVYAPGSIEECFVLTCRAFRTAERYQSPVVLLTDQFLADSYRAVEPFDVEHVEPVRPWVSSEPVIPYHRYALTADGVSPRLLPGLTEHVVVVDSDEHTEDGHITEDLDVRVAMVDKRLRKGEGICSEVLAPTYYGDNEPEVLLTCWGSAKGAVMDAVDALRGEKTSAAMLHFCQVWPLVPDHSIETFQRAHRVVMVEGNALGQMARLVRRETGFNIQDAVRRYDGLPLTPRYILDRL